MKPTPLTDDRLMSLGYNSGDPDGLLEFAKNVVSARDKQWQDMLSKQEAVAYFYTLEYGQTVADRKVSIAQLNYPFGVCGPDYLARNNDGVSYVRQTPLYTAPQPAQPKAEPHSDTRSAFESAIRCGLAKLEDWPAYEQGYSQGRYDAELQGPPAEDANKQLLEALKFYAEEWHFTRYNEDAWETVSGEPQNFFEDENNTARVEDGSVARAAIAAAEGETK